MNVSHAAISRAVQKFLPGPCQGPTLHGWCLRRIALNVAGVAACASVINSLILIGWHCQRNKHDALRSYTVRILLMVPIYSVNSFYVFIADSGEDVLQMLECFREFYEAIVIFSFLQFVISCVGGGQAVAAMTEHPEEKRVMHHLPPISWMMSPWSSARAMLHWCVRGTLSYVVVGMLSTFLSIFLFVIPVSRELEHQVNNISLLFLSVSQTFAIMGLATLAHNLMEELAGLQPVLKFVSVKMVVFFTFWQGLVLAALRKPAWIPSASAENGVQSFLLCLEMFCCSLAHFKAFPPEDYQIVVARVNGSKCPLNDVLVLPQRRKHLRRISQVVDFRDIWSYACDEGFDRRHCEGCFPTCRDQDVDCTTSSGDEESSDLESTQTNN